MSASRTNILNNLIATLKAIVTPTYALTVQTVIKSPRTFVPSQVSPADCPYIGILSNHETKEHLACNVVKCVWNLTADCFIVGSSFEDRLDQLDTIEDAVIVALNIDQTRGGNATSTLYIDTMRDDLSDSTLGIQKIEFEVTYYRTLTTSYT